MTASAATMRIVDEELHHVEGAEHAACPAATILIVDDEPQNRRLLEDQLHPEGYTTFTAASGEEALAAIAKRSPDLILLDVMMPGMDGYQLAGLLKADPATSSIPIIMVTAHVEREARLAGLAAGVEEFLTRPVDRAELLLRVRNLLRLKAFGDFLENYSVALEQQVQSRTHELAENERRFTSMLGNVDLVSVMLDREGRITYVNEYLLQLSGWREKEVIGRNWFESFMPPGMSDEKEVLAALLVHQPRTLHRENSIVTRSGERRLIRWKNSVIRSDTGEVTGVAAIGEDITESKRAETQVKRLNRVYAVLIGINSLIVRVRMRDELFREACRIAVDEGEFVMAWIGMIDPNARAMVPVASAGETREFLSRDPQRFSLAEHAPHGAYMSAKAVSDRKPIVSNDVQADPRIRFKDEHARRGSRSMAILPLVVDEEAVGVLALYASEADVFDDEEMKLLKGLAGDIAFAIDHIAKRELLDYLAYYDALTGLANRTLFLERVGQSLRAAASGAHKSALFLFDVERFKNINDSLGRLAGDALLKQVAQWLTRRAGDANLAARVDADHFAVLLPQVRPGGSIAHLVEKGLGAFQEHPFHLDEAVFRLAAKVGIAVCPEDGADVETLFRNAEAALKKAKSTGERYLFHAQSMTEAVAGTLTLENQLRQAVDRAEFVLHYQPKVCSADGKLAGAEALIRWNDPRAGSLVPPGRFIPVLEDTGLINEVGRWALGQAIADYLRWTAAGLPVRRVAVNVSPLQLRERGFIAEIGKLLAIDARAATGLELEITESLIMADVKHSIASLQAIREMGVTVAIDDFGTGFSSLSYLAKLPVDTLKIDRSFVVDMTGGAQGLALVSTIVDLAHALKLDVVAEGVETEEQRRLLTLLGCDQMQGFLFSRPVPGEVYESTFLAPGTPVPPAAP